MKCPYCFKEILGRKQRLILDFLYSCGNLTTKELSELTLTDSRLTSIYLRKLREKGLIERKHIIGRNVYYGIKEE